MNILAWKNMPAGLTAGVSWIAVAFLLTSCGGGDSGVDLGGGQSPDPVVLDYPLVYVKRPLPLEDDTQILAQEDVREVLPVAFGSDLWVRDRASATSDEVNITGAITNGFGDVRDVSIDHDAERVLFSMRTPVDPDGDLEDQPTFNIWEYDLVNHVLRRVMADDITAEEGQDIAPQWLPDGRILFSSTRQNRTAAKLLDEGKPQFSALDDERNEPAFVLHVMDDDGTNLTQVSFNQSHDLYPAVLDNGRVLFSRWNAINNQDEISLYHANPDGSDMQLLYGAESHATGSNDSIVQFLKPKELPDGRIIALLAPFSGTNNGGDLVIIETADYLNQIQPNVANQGVLTGPAQSAATVNVISTETGPSTGGRYASVWPLWDGTSRAVVSWSSCRVWLIDPDNPPADVTAEPRLLCTDENLQDPQMVEAWPSYGIWVYDFSDDTQKPVVLAQPGMMFTDVAVAQPRARPVVIQDIDVSGVADGALLSEDAGLLNIRSVYDFDGVDTSTPGITTLADQSATVAADRPARFIRIYKAVGIPDEETLDLDNAAFGIAGNIGMREIVGYGLVEPDGSVVVKVPADTPISLEILDFNGRRIGQRHDHWLQVRPGEVRTCNGCHDGTAPDISHGRADSFASVYAGAPGNGVPFPGTDAAVWGTINMGETMAEARTVADPDSTNMSVDIEYTDIWTHEPTAGRPADADFAIQYTDIVDTPPPAQFNCTPWTPGCRVLINYEDHIQPLWDLSRPILDPDTMVEIGNNRCIDCHALRDSDNELIDPDDRGQLELTSTASAAEPLHYTSYRELLFGDTLETLQDGAIQEVLQFQGNFDIDGNPIDEPVAIGSPMSAAGANASAAFFARFGSAGAHPDWLTEAELRLVAEWLDLGGQYFNNPFDGPVN